MSRAAATPRVPRPQISPTSRPSLSSPLTQAPASSSSGWLTIASTAARPTPPVAHWITRYATVNPPCAQIGGNPSRPHGPDSPSPTEADSTTPAESPWPATPSSTRSSAPASSPAEVSEVVLGCGTPQGTTGNNVGRLAAIKAGCPVTTTGVTVSRHCSSGSERDRHRRRPDHRRRRVRSSSAPASNRSPTA